MLTEPEKRRIIEEEQLRKQVRGYTSTDWLASCILGPVIVLGLMVGAGLLLLLAAVLFTRR